MMNVANHQRDFILEEKLSKIMWRLSLPAIAAMVLYGLNAFMDTVYIGQLLNEDALTGVALAYPLTSIMMGLGSWAGTGAANILSIAIGNNDTNTQQKIVANSTLLSIFTTCVIAMPCYFFAEPLIRMLGGTGEILEYGVRYFKIALIGAPLWVYGLTLNFIVRGEGKMKEAAIMMIFGLALNMMLTPIFISFLNLDVEGAAWATNLGMLLYCIVGFLYFYQGRASFNANITSLKFDRDTFLAILKSGFPGFIMTIMGLIQAIVVFNAIVNNGGNDELTLFAAANRIMLFLMTPLFGLMRALQPVAGINYGAGNYDRVKSSFLKFSGAGFLIIAPFWLLITIFPTESINLVLPNRLLTSQEVIDIRIFMVMLPLLPLVFMGLTFFPAINREKYGSIIGMARQLVFYVPAVLILPRMFGVQWMYYASTIIDVTVTLWILIIIRKLFKELDVLPISNQNTKQDERR